MENKPLSFRQREVCSAIMCWWRELQNDKSSRALLSSARSVEQVYAIRAFHVLRKAIRSEGVDANDDRLAATAMLIAQIRTHDDTASLGFRMGKSCHRPSVVSEIRFLGLSRAKTLPALIKEVSSILSLLEYRANVLEVAETVYWWGGKIIKKLSLDYYDSYLASNG